MIDILFMVINYILINFIYLYIYILILNVLIDFLSYLEILGIDAFATSFEG